MDFERGFTMKDKNHKQDGRKEQVHSEFETSIGNDFNVVREETPVKKKKDGDQAGTLNELPPDEDSVKNENSAGEEVPKLNAEEKS